MKKIINKVILLGLLLSTGMAACKKQLDINQNPNAVTETNITADLILPNALNNVGAQTAVGNQALIQPGNIPSSYGAGYGWVANWMGHFSPSGSYNPSTEESTYNITNTFQETRWSGIYNVLFDMDNVEKKAIASGQPFYRAIAMIMKAHLFQFLVDMYGNVPYSQAFKPLEFPSPAYDQAEAIYADLHVKLDTAISIMQGITEITSAEEGVDIVYHGDTDLWARLGNTIKLRLLIRTSEINPNPAAELAKIKANGGVLQSGESAEVNPGYINDVGKQNPFYSAYGLAPSGNQANEYYRANAYIISLLRNSGDPRISYFFSPAKNTGLFTGTVYGSNPDAEFSGDRTSNIGPGLAKSFDQPQWIVTSVESMFLQAEAVARGWDVGYAGTTQEAYEEAVTESFAWLGVLDLEPEALATYLTGSNIAKWSNAGTAIDQQVKFIVRQKYIALIGIDELEVWSDYRRLGVPADVPLSVNPARGTRTIPVRLIYPQAEYAVNAASVAAQGAVTPMTKIFWDK